MAVTIEKVITNQQLKKFVRFNYELYKGDPYKVPELYGDMLDTLSRTKNAAFEFCEADYFLAFKEGRIVGRIAAIINYRANEKWNVKAVRFGWIDFIDDLEVSRALLQTVEDWGRERGMNTIQGPLGFTDFDPEGMLIEGFNELGTMASTYNYPYYAEHIKQLGGFEKEADWVEFKIYVPSEVPAKHKRISEIILKKYNLRIVKITSAKQIVSQYGQAIFDLMNEAYEPLYGYSALSQGQIKQYIKTYLPMLDLRLVTLVVDENDQLVCVGISMPSLSTALQKAKGKLFPFGWWHLLKALKWKHAKMVDLLLVAVKPEFQNKGVNALVFYDLIPIYSRLGYEYGESNPELEMNDRVQAQWDYFENVQHKRRRAFKKMI